MLCLSAINCRNWKVIGPAIQQANYQVGDDLRMPLERQMVLRATGMRKGIDFQQRQSGSTVLVQEKVSNTQAVTT